MALTALVLVLLLVVLMMVRAGRDRDPEIGQEVGQEVGHDIPGDRRPSDRDGDDEEWMVDRYGALTLDENGIGLKGQRGRKNPHDGSDDVCSIS